MSRADDRGDGDDRFVEVDRGAVVWRFEREFLESNWTCLYGRGCKGILAEPAEERNEGCCSLGAHFGDGRPGRHEAMQIAAAAAMLTPDVWQHHAAGTDRGAGGIFGDDGRTHTRVVDGACVFLNRPGFAGGEGCALHLAALAAGESPIEWKPSVCWQLPLRVDWKEVDAGTETATVRRWTRADWSEHGETMAWCCTERDEGGEAYIGEETRVVDSLSRRAHRPGRRGGLGRAALGGSDRRTREPERPPSQRDRRTRPASSPVGSPASHEDTCAVHEGVVLVSRGASGRSVRRPFGRSLHELGWRAAVSRVEVDHVEVGVRPRDGVRPRSPMTEQVGGDPT